MEGAKSVKFTLPVLPPSKNRLRAVDHIRRRVYLTDEARQWKNRIYVLIPRFDIAESSFLHLSMEFHYPYLYQNGRLRIFDAANMQEILQDTICERIRVNDCRVKSWQGSSVDDEDEYVVVTLNEIEQPLTQPTTDAGG